MKYQKQRQRGRASWWPFITAAFTIVVLLTGTNIPTPLYPTYQKVFGFPPLVITLVFAVYAIALIPSLLIFGPLSDAIGRRRVLIPAVIAAVIGSILFATASSTSWLFAARIVQGLALGAVQGTASATLIDTEPTGNRRRAALAGSLSVAGGGAIGPALGGVLAQYGPAPRVFPYLVELGLLGVALLCLLRFLPRRSGARKSWRPRRPSIPAAIRRTFAAAGATAFVAWAVTALFLALMPSYVSAVLHTHNLALVGVIIGMMLGCSAFSQVMLLRLSSLTAQVAGLGLLASGLTGVIVATRTGSIVVIITATVLAGFGQGLAFGGSLAEVNAVASPERRGDIMSSFYVVIYLGVALPIIGVGFLALSVGVLQAVQTFAYIVVAACLLALIALRVNARRLSRLPPVR